MSKNVADILRRSPLTESEVLKIVSYLEYKQPLKALWTTLTNQSLKGTEAGMTVVRSRYCGLERKVPRGESYYSNDYRIKAEEGATPLMMAVVADRFDVLQSLVELGADVNVECSAFTTALKLATIKSDLAMMDFLLDHNSRMDEYALQRAMRVYSSQPAAELLIAHGCNINVQVGSGPVVSSTASAANLVMMDPGLTQVMLDAGFDMKEMELRFVSIKNIPLNLKACLALLKAEGCQVLTDMKQ